jgi:hypothetical protein
VGYQDGSGTELRVTKGDDLYKVPDSVYGRSFFFFFLTNLFDSRIQWILSVIYY